jgi:ABC-type phosphate transport system auxiliary subunit
MTQTLKTQHGNDIQTLTEQLQKERNENKRLRQDQALHHESLTSQKHATREALLDNEALQSELVVLQSKLAALQQHPHNHSPAGQTHHNQRSHLPPARLPKISPEMLLPIVTTTMSCPLPVAHLHKT